MTDHPPLPFLEGLGVLAHGPHLLGAGPGVSIGLRCIFAHPEGLLLSLQVKAVGGAAERAHEGDRRGTRGGSRGRGEPRRPDRDRRPVNFVRLFVIAPQNDDEPQPGPELHHHLHTTAPTTRSQPADPGSDGPDEDAPGFPVHVQDIDVWWPALPLRARLTLRAGWPEMGVPLTTTVLQLRDLDQVHDGVVGLR